MTKKTFCGILAAMLICAMAWIMIPSHAAWDNLTTTVSHLKDSDIITDDVASAEASNIQTEAALHSLPGYYEPPMAYRHLKRLVYLKTHIRENGLANGQIMATLAYLSGIRAQQVGSIYGKAFTTGMSRLTNSHEFKDLTDFQPVTTEWNFRPMVDHWKNNYPVTVMLAVPFFICMLVRRGFNPLVEFVMPLRLAGACAFWPIGAFFYPTSDPARQVERAIRGLGYALCFLISLCSANLAKAQKKDPGETRWEVGRALQVDAATDPPLIGDPPQTDDPQKTPDVVLPETPKATYQINLYADGHERQSWFIANFRHWSLYQQNRSSTDGASPFSYLGIGPKFRIGSLWVTAWVGPQWTYRTAKVDKMSVYSLFNIKRPKWSLLSANKFAFSTNGKNLFADRHVQNIHAPPMPSWLSFQGEELQVPSAKKRWQEIELGPMVNIGSALRLHARFWKDCYLYPFRDLARREWNLRVGYAHAFGK